MSLAALSLHLAPPPNPVSWPGAVSEASDLEAGDVTHNLAGDNQCFTPSGVLWFPPLPSAIIDEITSRWKHLNQPTNQPATHLFSVRKQRKEIGQGLGPAAG